MAQLTFFPGFSPATDAGLFEHGADGIFNTVNTKGTGKTSRGVAGQVFTRFPEVHDAYMNSCRHSNPQYRLKPGMILPVEVNAQTGAREQGGGLWILNAATKDDWRDPSKMEWIESIAGKLNAVADKGVRRIAMPPMGCGEGGLDWKRQVGPMLRPHLENLAKRGVDVLVFAEDPAPERGMGVSVRPEDNRKSGRSPVAAPPRLDSSGLMLDATHWYAGVGARPWTEDRPTGTPPKVVARMKELGQALAEEGWGLRSGGAAGADDAFERGARQASKYALQIFLPQDRFNGRQVNGREYLGVEDPALDERAKNMARKLHPAGNRLSGFALNAMGRNAFQVLGRDLESPSNALVCYTHEGGIVGGTGHALKLCEIHDIPVINLGDSRWKSASVKDVVSAMGDIREGREPRAPQKRAVRGGDER